MTERGASTLTAPSFAYLPSTRTPLLFKRVASLLRSSACMIRLTRPACEPAFWIISRKSPDSLSPLNWLSLRLLFSLLLLSVFWSPVLSASAAPSLTFTGWKRSETEVSAAIYCAYALDVVAPTMRKWPCASALRMASVAIGSA